jgi:hypothetical protein
MGSAGGLSSLSDRSLQSRLAAYCRADQDHWSFRGNAVRHHGHAYFQYPAMMVPQMVGDLLTAVVEKSPCYRHIYDPFAGSGTALTEAMMRGLDFSGQDINPLAVLLCEAKAIPFFDGALKDKLAGIVEMANSDAGRTIEASFPGRRKWFSAPVATKLSRLRRAIRAETSLWARRFMWVALAETVRLTSNSRTSTFKLHIRPAPEIAARRVSPLVIFQQTAERNIEHLSEQKELLAKRGFVDRGHYSGTVNVRIADTASVVIPSASDPRFDILVTSPPYGDNVTTVPYGQHSYLPLQWIDLADISPTLEPDCLVTTHEIDRRSLGGSRRHAKAVMTLLRDNSPTLGRTIDALKGQPADRAARVISFCRDLEQCIAPVMAAMRKDAIMIWILGNRRVGGNSVPLDQILSEFLINRGSRAVTIIKRDIPSKRMAVRNSVSATMRSESIVVMRKCQD